MGAESRPEETERPCLSNDAGAFAFVRPHLEASHGDTTQRDKQLTREYLERRTYTEDPPPPEEIRRQLGSDLIPGNGPVREVAD